MVSQVAILNNSIVLPTHSWQFNEEGWPKSGLTLEDHGTRPLSLVPPAMLALGDSQALTT